MKSYEVTNLIRNWESEDESIHLYIHTSHLNYIYYKSTDWYIKKIPLQPNYYSSYRENGRIKTWKERLQKSIMIELVKKSKLKILKI